MCRETVNEEVRLQLWNEFHTYNFSSKRGFIFRNVAKQLVKIKRIGSKGDIAYVYKLNETVVCKDMFISTLGHKNFKFVHAAFKSDGRGRAKKTSRFTPVQCSERNSERTY